MKAESKCGFSSDQFNIPCFQQKDSRPSGNITVIVKNPLLVTDVWNSLEKQGCAVLPVDTLIGVTSLVMDKLNMTMPSPNVYTDKEAEGLSKKERAEVIRSQRAFTDEVFSRVHIVIRDGAILFRLQDDPQNLDQYTDYNPHNIPFNDERIKEMKKYQAMTMGLKRCVSSSLSSFSTFVAVLIDSPMGGQQGPVINVVDFNEDSLDGYTGKVDGIIVNPDKSGPNAVLCEAHRFYNFQARRGILESKIGSGQISLEPQFAKNSWPSHPLMNYLKANVRPLTEEASATTLCDAQDIRYQTLFRLTTYPLNEVFIGGDRLQSLMREMGIYDDWKKMPLLDEKVLQSFPVNVDLVKQVIQEQMIIIRQRLEQSTLPVEHVLRRTGIFAEEGWELEKDDGAIWAMQKTDPNNKIPVAFKPIDPVDASTFHNDFHYIHTPRCDLAFGLFLGEDEVPFSVLSLQKTDRPYKQDLLLMHGFNPNHCFDLSRLYSKPGTPFNTSSAFFSLVFSYLRHYKPETEAILSAFMPTYAAGLSMTSGGFDNPVLIKPCVHKFVSREIQGQTVWEYTTNRRLGSEDIFIETSPTFPMLPTIELMAALRSPRFKPFETVKGKMVVLGRDDV